MTQNKVGYFKAVNENANARMANTLKEKDLNIQKDLGYKKFGTDAANAAIKGLETAGKVAAGIVAANDPEFYKRVPGVAEPLCKAQFFNPTGIIQALGFNPEDASNDLFASCPSVAVIHYVPSIGTTFRGSAVSGETQPLPITDNAFTVNAKKIIAGLVSKSGVFSSGIDPQDVLAALCCEVDLWSFIHTVRKLIAAVDMYSIENKTMPRYLCGAILGLQRPLTSAEMLDLQVRKLDMISWLNSLIEGANTMRLPKQLTLLSRRLFLADAICYDDDKRFNQLYMYKQDAYLKWSDTVTVHGHYTEMTGQKWMNDPESGALVSIGSTPIFDYLTSFGNELLNALIGSSDISTINGALLRYYKNEDDYYHEDAYKLDVKYELIGFFDYLSASQIRNTKFVGPIAMNNVYGIRLQEYDNQDGTFVQLLEVMANYNTSYITKSGNVQVRNVLLNSKGDEVNEDEVLEMTRNCSWVHKVPVMASSSGSTTTHVYLACGGTEVFTYMSIISNMGMVADTPDSDPASFEDLDSYVTLRWHGARVTVDNHGLIPSDLKPAYVDYVFRHLKNCPFGFVGTPMDQSQSNICALWIGDPIENACAMPVNKLTRIHYACVYSEIYLDVRYE